MSALYTENYDAPTAPALPSDGTLNYTGGSLLVTSTTFAYSGINSIWANTTTVQNWFSAATDGVNGDCDNAHKWLFSTVGGSDKAEVSIRCQTQASTNQIFVSLSGSGTVQLFKRVGGTATQFGSTVTVTGGLTVNRWYNVYLKGIGNVYTVIVTDMVTGFTLNSSGVFVTGANVAINYTDSGNTFVGTAAYLGYQISNSTAGHVYGDDAAANSDAAIAITQPVPTSVGPTSVTLSVTASGGTGIGYTYQWYRNSVANFTPGAGNILTGQTASTITDSTVVVGTVYYYACIVIDSGSNTVTSASTPTKTGVAPNNLQIIVFGDSICNKPTYPTDTPVVYLTDFLQTLVGVRTITVYNCGINGSDSTNDAGGWNASATSNSSTSGNTIIISYGGTNNYMTGLLAAAAALFPTGIVYFLYEGGRNDALLNQTTTTQNANIAAICTTILGTNTNYRMILQAPISMQVTATTGWTNQRNDSAVSYQPGLVAQAAANPTTTYLGDNGGALLAIASNYSAYLQTDGHPNDLGAQILGQYWAIGVAKALNPTLFGSITAGGGIISG